MPSEQELLSSTIERKALASAVEMWGVVISQPRGESKLGLAETLDAKQNYYNEI